MASETPTLNPDIPILQISFELGLSNQAQVPLQAGVIDSPPRD